jgi:hypothetical protein
MINQAVSPSHYFLEFSAEDLNSIKSGSNKDCNLRALILSAAVKVVFGNL